MDEKLQILPEKSVLLSRVCKEPEFVKQANETIKAKQALEELAKKRLADLENAARRWQDYIDEVEDLSKTVSECKQMLLSPYMEKKTLQEQLEVQKVRTGGCEELVLL